MIKAQDIIKLLAEAITTDDDELDIEDSEVIGDAINNIFITMRPDVQQQILKLLQTYIKECNASNIVDSISKLDPEFASVVYSNITGMLDRSGIKYSPEVNTVSFQSS